ncbi:hypothetical protein P7M58_23170, partial [Vibrio parahaemolyticus]|nr:hypothetical protein [Vibrio parahaemolyticus]
MMKIKPSLWALMLTTLSLIGCNNGDEGLLGDNNNGGGTDNAAPVANDVAVRVIEGSGTNTPSVT